MGISSIEATTTISTTEISIANVSAGAGQTYSSASPQTTDACVEVWLDWSAVAAGDVFRLRGYEKVNAGTQRMFHESFPPPGISEVTVPATILLDAWDWTLLKVSGTDRAIRSSVRLVT